MAMGPIHSGGQRQRRAPMAEINVTPMVDVMLVLLIIFMVTAPLLVAGVPVDLPETKAGALDQEQKPVVISLDKSGAIFIDDQAIAGADLANRLAAVAARPGGAPRVFLRADQALDYGRVSQVMGEINAAGLRKLALVSTQGREKQ